MKQFLLSILVAFVFLLNGSTISFAQTSLGAGDIAIIRMNEDSPSDAFSFVTLVPISSGTIIYFTWESWGNSLWNGNFKSHLKYTAPAGGLSAGSVVHIDENVYGITFSVSAGKVS